MTTASVYYDQHNWPDFVLIDGDQATITRVDAGPDAKRNAVDQACRTLGWQVMAEAPIVRQADGRGTVRVEPTAELLAAADRATDATNERTAAELAVEATAYITVEFNGTLGNVAVDGRAMPLPPGLTSEPTPARRWMIDPSSLKAVDAALGRMGYKRAGAVRFHEDARTWQCQVERVAADWRDMPTLVRINDDAAEVLQEAAAKLGIPADRLASVYIGGAAEAALRKQDSAIGRGGWLADHSRIRGWMAAGIPHLDEPGPISYDRFADRSEGTE